jgi:hypothetical protein
MDLKILQTMQSDEQKKQYLQVNGIDPSQLDFFLTTIEQSIGAAKVIEEMPETTDNSSEE